MNDRKKVYISSTYEDLKPYREAAYRALRRLGHDAIAMEDYVAAGQHTPLNKCLADVDSCDWYVGIFAWRYGYIPDDEENPEGKSITELEYCQAKQKQKPCFIFLLHEDADWSLKQTDLFTGAGEKGERINELRQELGKTKLLSYFKYPNELAEKLITAIAKWERENNQGNQVSKEPPIRENGQLVCPYQGLLAFTKKERPFFFGRQEVVEAIYEKLIQGKNFIPLIGASGSGKSSVVLAGLIPWLEEKGWEVLDPPIKPGKTPLERLERVLWKYFSEEEELLKECIYGKFWDLRFKKGLIKFGLILLKIDCLVGILFLSDEGLKPLLESFPGGQHLLVVDQFEELFTVAQAEQRDRFIQLITQVAELPDSPLVIVTTMRADFVEPCLNYESLSQLIEKNAKYLSPLVGKNLIAAICEPAKRQGYEVTDKLLNQILIDIKLEPGFLPLLEFALTQLWETRNEEAHNITLKCYEEIDGVIGSLNLHANDLYKQFTEKEEKLVKRIFMQLLQLGEGTKDIRKRQSKQNLLFIVGENKADQEALRKVLKCLIDGRLLVTGQEDEDYIDLAHEALIEGWDKLDEWRKENREGRKLVRDMENGAEDYWKEHLKSPKDSIGFLWIERKLDYAEEVLKKDDVIEWLSEQAQKFLEECRKQGLRSFLGKLNIDNLDQRELEKEAAFKPFLTKPLLRSLLEDNKEDLKVRQEASWVLKQWGENVSPIIVLEKLPNGMSLELVEIPGGKFNMGSPEVENEKPQHEVTVQSFLMGKYPITQAQYQEVMGNNPSHNIKGDDQRPVEKVSWNDAVEFCQRLLKLTGKEYRLPSEAEWEYACRAGTTTAYHFGDDITDKKANYDKNVGETTAVGEYPPNAFGLCDMHGNVWEWCQDDWHDDYKGAPTDGSAWLSDKSIGKVRRGGSWSRNTVVCCSAFRIFASRDFSNFDLGFRVVCVVPSNT